MKKKRRPARRKSASRALQQLVLADQIREHRENISVLAGWLAAGRADPGGDGVEPELTVRTGHFILNEIRALGEVMEQLNPHPHRYAVR